VTLLAHSARALARLVRDGELSAGEVTRTYLDQIATTESSLHAYRRVLSDRALADAERIDKARARGARLGPLAGVPVGLKDIFVTQGIETGCGSSVLEGWVPGYDGTHARRLAEAGAILLGKQSMDEFAMGGSNENTPYEPVRNPWSSEHVPGGSSGGSAASVAARSSALSLGTDTGGSIRQPASLCGVVGLKPTYGRVSRHGMVAFASSLDQAGPLARDVRDAALALSVIAGRDPLDATSLDAPVPDYLSACDQDASGLRIGVHRPAIDSGGLDDEVRSAFDTSLEVLTQLGATIVDVDLAHFEYAIATYYVLCMAEASSNLARYDGLRYGPRVDRDTLGETYEATRQAFGAEVKRRIMLGTFVLRADSYEQYYGRAMRVRTLVARDYADAFAGCDLIASPTFPTPGFRLGERVQDPLAMYLSDAFTVGANLAGLPAISVPGGFSTAPRLPIGLQLIGPRLAEETLLRAAAAYEGATSWHTEHAPGVPG
jgi:aspartyl-tRNA(Asn)/glutamyl-tRNA(Gln) amidotransferase subunit A